MKTVNIKKAILPNLPYAFIALYATKLGQAARLSPGADFSAKALHIMEGFAAAFQSALPSFHPIDLCVGIAAALLIRLAVYVKGKNARKLDLPELRELVSLLRYSSNNLNQLARRVHETGRVYAADMEDILQNQERIWQAASGILSRLAAIK